MRSKQHLFLMIYPEEKDLRLVFDRSSNELQAQEWDEGLAVGFIQAKSDEEVQKQIEFIIRSASQWLNLDSEIKDVQI